MERAISNGQGARKEFRVSPWKEKRGRGKEQGRSLDLNNATSMEQGAMSKE